MQPPTKHNKEAIKKSDAIVVTCFLAIPQRLPDFKLNAYYWGLRWTNGMIVQCGKHTNPWGDMKIGGVSRSVGNPAIASILNRSF